jgi:peptidyl-prolyl cis-trans isomerase A (cyclophilin A)
LKADAEAAMEKFTGFEKQKVVCVTNSFKRRRKASCSWKTVSVHYEGSLESGKVLIALIKKKTN